MEAFSKDGVVSDVLDAAPPALLQLKYGDLTITPGKTVTPTQVQNQPEVSWPSEEGALYTIIMNDPDAPSREDPKFGEWHHWMVGNISGNDVSSGDVIAAFVGSGPPPNTGLHRYVFVVYKQQGREAFEGLPRIPNTSADKRAKTKVRDIVAKYNLGPLVAGNFYFAEFDDYCPKLYKQMGM